MWGVISSVFIILYLLMGIYIGRRGWTTLGKSNSKISKIIFWLLFIILFLSYPATGFLRRILPQSMNLSLTLWGYYFMIAASYTFLIVLFIDFIRVVDKKINFFPAKLKSNEKTPFVISILVLVSVVSTIFYGIFNAKNPVIKEYEININKKSTSIQELNIVMVSDIHFGEIINIDRIKQLSDAINKIQPDIILLPGDIVEGNPSNEDGQKLAEILGNIKTKYGIFAVPGNHDRGLRDSESQLSIHFKNAGINILKDNYIRINNNFYIIGRDDARFRNGQARKEISELINGVDDSLPVILMDHQPVDINNAKKFGIDLQVSGHTHRGQIFPINFITGQIYDLDWGIYKNETYHLIVSCGYGTWGPPVRIGTNPEIVNIKVKFN